MRKIKANKISYIIISIMMLMLCQNASAQGFTATGTVVDTSKEPLIGATVKVVGTSGGSVTDINGAFTVQCDEGATLEISYVGYVAQTVNAAKNMTITLQETANMLAETTVVGVGYGQMRKSDLTGAIASVNAKDLKHGVITSTEQMLQGKVAGLSIVQSSGAPEAGASIRLRGGTSLSASNGPLIVIDGIPGVDINSVQPTEIVSMDVLKDASAAAIYGSRGANGVIIITTKREGTETESNTIQYNGYVAFSSAAKNIDMLSADQWRGYVRERGVASALDFGANTDWQKELERTAVSQSHNIMFSNSTKDHGFRASVTYQDNQGVIKRSSMNRLAGSLTAYQTAWQGRLRLDEGIDANFDNWTPIDNRIFERMLNVNPTFPVYNPDGSFAQLSGTNTENPVELNTNRSEEHSRHRFLGYLKADLMIIEGLHLAANLSYEQNDAKNNFYKPTYARMEGQSLNGWGQRADDNSISKQFELYATYDKKFNDIHHLNVMAGYSYFDHTYDGFGAIRSGFVSDAFGANNLGAGSAITQGDVSSYKGNDKLVSFFGRVNYTLMNRYMITATVRQDGSSRFGANHKWGTFPSVSAAWRVSEESFMQGTRNWLDNLKLRLGWGVTGNQSGIGEYRSLSILSPNGASYFDPTTGQWMNSYMQSQNANPDLKWESTSQFNLGIDFAFLNRFNGSIELYYKKTSDLLWTYPVPQPPYIVGTMLANVGDLENKGIEFTFGANIIRTKDWTFDANMSLSYNYQNITKLSNDQYQAVGLQAGSLHYLRGLSGTYAQVIQEGYPAGAFWGPKCDGIDAEGKYILEKDKDGNVVNQYLGSAQPKFNLGLSLSATYKDFDLGVSGYGMFGQKVLNATRMAMFDTTRFPSQNVPDEFMTKNITSDPTFSSYFIEKGDFFRLSTLTLGYTLRHPEVLGLSRLRVYATAENLFCLTGYSGLDPEVGLPDNVLESPGIDIFNSYPRPRTFSVGLNVSF